MSLLTILRSGIKTIDKIVKPLEAVVAFSKFTDDGTGTGSGTYGPVIDLRAIVEWKEVSIPSASGIINATRPTILFLDYVALMAATLGQGLKEQDLLVLGDGTTGPIQNLSGFMDAGTNRPIYTEVYLG